MKNKLKKIIFAILISIFVVLIVYNANYNYEKKKDRKDLTIKISNQLERFGGIAGTGFKNESLYAEEYGYIVSAKELLYELDKGRTYGNEEYDSSLPVLLRKIERMMLEDRDKVDKVFSDMKASKLIFDIALNFENKEATKKLIELLD